MKKIRMAICLSCWLAFLIATPLWAEDSEVARRSLKDLKAVHIVIESLPKNIQKYSRYLRDADLNEARLRRDIEAKLGSAGLRVLSREEWLNTPGRPVLYVNINIHENEKYWLAYNIKLEIQQIALLEANPSVKVLAATWSISVTGMTNIGNLRMIRQEVDVLADRFTKSHTMANKEIR